MTGAPAGSRVGWGFDAHGLDGKPPLLMGGIEVSNLVGVSATSDGDLVAHALTDAILGAAVMGDIGEHFPSDEVAWRDADSMFFLRQASTMATAAGWMVTHVDVTVIAEGVRVAPHRDAIRASLAYAVGAPVEAVSVKATTTDGLGFIGSGEGLAAVAVVTVSALP